MKKLLKLPAIVILLFLSANSYAQHSSATKNANSNEELANKKMLAENFTFKETTFKHRKLYSNVLQSKQILSEKIFSKISRSPCIDSQTYDIDNFIADNGTWTANSNPVAPTNSTIYIKSELRIPPGKTLTIKNMTLKFAPGARLVVENGTGGMQGGKLIITDNTTLTLDSRCPSDEYWLGVEVWGNSYEAQHTIANTSQGVFKILGKSKIEYAINGVLLAKRNENEGEILPESYAYTNNGGIILASEYATFLNCVHGIQFSIYNVGTENLSTITSSSFEWDENFIQSRKPVAHILINRCTNIRITASKFLQSATQLYTDKDSWGIGVLALNSTFSVLSTCFPATQIGYDCPEQHVKPSIFKNLRTGILVSNINGKPFTVLRNEFENCVAGVSSQNATNQIISRNKFKIHADDRLQTWGIFISTGDKYKVEENILTSVDGTTAQSYGIIIDNSGVLHNALYKNNFSSLYIGTQAQRNNGRAWMTGPNDAAGGLRYFCNQFFAPINYADIAVAANSRIDYQQGRPGGLSEEDARNTNTARNRFSYTGNGATDFLLGTGTHQVNYYHLGDANHEPLTFTNTAPMIVLSQHQQFGYGNYLYSNANTCPTKFPVITKKPRFDLYYKKMSIVDSLNKVIDNGKTDELLMLINSHPSSEVTINALANASPYLSDTVLKSLIFSTISDSKLKEILIANSQLSNSVIHALKSTQRPTSIMKDIVNYQNKPSAQQLIFQEISLREEDLYEYKKEFISSLYNEATSDKKTDSLLYYMNLFKGEEFAKELLSIYSSRNDEKNFKRILNENENRFSADYIFCLETIFELDKKIDWNTEKLDNQIISTLQSIALSSKDEEASSLATNILDSYNNKLPEFMVAPIFIDESEPAANVRPNQQTAINNEKIAIEMYPNPSTGVVQLVFSELETKSISVQVTDLTGKSVYDSQFENTSSEKIDLTHLKKGTYLVSISINGLKPESKLLILE